MCIHLINEHNNVLTRGMAHALNPAREVRYIALDELVLTAKIHSPFDPNRVSRPSISPQWTSLPSRRRTLYRLSISSTLSAVRPVHATYRFAPR
jgi:hypothetical protein